MADSHQDLREKLTLARTAIAEGRAESRRSSRHHLRSQARLDGQQVAFVFPGQGAQSPGMLRELAVLFPEVRATFEDFDRALSPAAAAPWDRSSSRLRLMVKRRRTRLAAR